MSVDGMKVGNSSHLSKSEYKLKLNSIVNIREKERLSR